MNLANLTIRLATFADAQRVADLAARTFRQTYAGTLDAIELERHIERTFHERIQRDELTDPARRTLLLHEAGDSERDLADLGYAQLRRTPGQVPACLRAACPIELQRFYLEVGAIGRGLGRRLMDAVKAAAVEAEADVLWLCVWEHNPPAIAFYRKCGFEEVGETGFPFGSALLRDLVMRLALD